MSDGLDWTAGGPRSRRFDDVYFSAEDGLAESRLVFLQGCGLPEAWTGRERFVVGELGFGSGLNVLALIDLWRRERPSAAARLHVLSVEGFPLAREDAARALAAWPELADLAAPLLTQWPDGRRGFHRIDLPAWNVTLDLALMEVDAALRAWSGRADAWFLDGFAPSRNPEMWSPEVMALVTARSRLGARTATYSVAGAVRQALQTAGFALERRPGFGRKKQRLEARLPGERPTDPPLPRVAIIGGGIAGAALARGFARQGVRATLIEAEGPGAGASGNPAALVTPRLDAGLSLGARLHAQAFARAVRLYQAEAPGAVIAHGALQLQRRDRDSARFAAIADWDAFRPGGLEPIDAERATALIGEAVPAALRLSDALTIEPSEVLSRWTAHTDRLTAHIAGLEGQQDGSWGLIDDSGRLVLSADVVCLAAGLESTALAGLPPMRPVRGQASWSDHDRSIFATAWGGYAIPTRTGVLFGATHERGDLGTEVRPQDNARNLQTLAQARPELAAGLAGTPLSGRAGVRAATPDHLPLAGAVPGAPGLFILAGLGGRGFTLAPILAEHVAAEATGAPSPLPRDLAPLVSPGRFAEPEPPRD